MSYSPTHPWYYVTGATILSLRGIAIYVKERLITGYRQDEIDHIDRMAEPMRSSNLSAMRAEIRQRLLADYRLYHKYALILVDKIPETDPQSCDDIHMNISIKCAHLMNDIAHLISLESLNTQRDLFSL